MGSTGNKFPEIIEGSLESRFAEEEILLSQEDLDTLAEHYYSLHGLGQNRKTYNIFVDIYLRGENFLKGESK